MAAQNLILEHYLIEIVGGPEKGVKFKLDPNLKQVLIGRSPECDIRLTTDPKLSRKHMIMEFGQKEVVLTNLSNKNEVSVNGQRIQRLALSNGDLVRFGSSKFMFTIAYQNTMYSQGIIPAMPTNDPLAQQNDPYSFSPDNMAQSNVPAAGNGNSISEQANYFQSPLPGRNKQNTPPKKLNTTFIGTVAVIVILVIWLLNSEKTPVDETLELRTPEQTEKEIAELAEKKRKHIENLRTSGKTTREYQDAQAAFIQGFRDYQQGQFGRALESFEMAETLYKNHPEATRYKFLAQRKLAELVQYKLDRGKKYRDRNNYKMCQAELKTVMVMIKNPQHTLYKEAKAMFDDCDLMLKGRF
jgi:hypothetical protein